MGFSVSGAAAILFASLFIAFGMFYTSTFNAAERVTDARTASSDSYLVQQNTDVAVSATYDDANDLLTVKVNNTGASELLVDNIDVIIDGQYRTSFQSTTVDGDQMAPSSDTNILAPGQQLTYEISRTSKPNRLKVVTGPGIAAFNRTVPTT